MIFQEVVRRGLGQGGALVLGALLLAGCGGGATSSLRKADSLYEKGKLEDAVALWEVAIQEAETTGEEIPPETWVDLGHAYEELGKPAKALTSYQRAASMGAATADVYFRMGKIQAAQGDVRTAAASWTSALGQDPTNTTYLGALQGALESEGLHQEFVAVVRDVVARGPEGAQLLSDLGVRYQKEGRPAAAADAFEGAVALDSARTADLTALAQLRMATREWEQAAVAWEGAARAAPSVDAWKSLGTCRLKLRRYEPARDAFQKAQELTGAPDPELIAGMALASHGMGQTAPALKQLEKATAERPKQVVLWLAMARIQIDRAQWKGATRALEVVRSIDPGNAEGAMLMGYALMRQEMPLKAEAMLKQATAAAPTDPEAHAHLCALYGSMQRYDEAVAVCRVAADNDPLSSEAPLNLAHMLLAAGEWSQGLSQLEDVSRERPEDLAVAVELGRLSLAVGRVDDALTLARRATASHPDSVAAATLLGMVLAERGEATLARDQLQRATRMNEKDPQAPAAFARFEAGRRRLDEARRHLAQAEARAPSALPTRHAAAMIVLAEGRPQEAVTLLEALRQQAPADLLLVADQIAAMEAAGRIDAAGLKARLARAGE